MSKRVKHEVKVLTYHELGMKLDDQLDAAKAEQSSFEGSKKAFALGRAKVEELTAHIDKDVRDGTLDLEQSTLAKRWVLRAVAVLQNLGIQAEVQGYQAQGKVMALTQAVNHTKVLHDQEKSLLDAAIAAESQSSVETVDSGRPAVRAMGEHPGNPLADRREGTDDSEEAKEQVVTPEDSDAGKKPAKRRKV